MPKFIDRTGQRYSRLVVLEQAGRNAAKKVLWKCKCDCGNEVIVDACSLVTRNTESCGCYHKERITKHGGWKNASYNTWRAMMRRCYNPKDKDYKKYGAVGVSVYGPWHEYTKFQADMGEPTGDETLDRINPTGNYEPDNCRWAGITTQNRNVRVRTNSKTGITGVSKTHSGTYMAKITAKSKNYYSKCYATLTEASEARKELEKIHWST